jgi:hypothetical protein
VQDQIAQILVCVALGCALSAAVAAALVRPDSARGWLTAVLPRMVVAAGPIYLAADYVLYQKTATMVCAAAAFAAGLWVLRGWWAPIERPTAWPNRRDAIRPAAPAAVFDLAGRRRASAARAVLRDRMLAVVRDDRRPNDRWPEDRWPEDQWPDDRSMPSAA